MTTNNTGVIVDSIGCDNKKPDMNDMRFKQWLKLSYRRKPGEEKAGYYEYEGEFWTKEEMFQIWLAILNNKST